jgi:pilus assembly protein CpaF
MTTDLNTLTELAPLVKLLNDTDVTEILVNSARDIYFEKQGQLKRSADLFLTADHYLAAIDRLTESGQTFLNREKPFIETQMGDWRLTLIFSEISGRSPLLSLRRRSRIPWNLEKLCAANWCAVREYEFLSEALIEKRNILVVGPTSSGKTTVLQALLHSLEASERVLIIEDTQELNLPNQASASLLTRAHVNANVGAIDLTELIQKALRLRPDRLVIGEVRGPEAYALLLALSTGHEGSFGSLHARNTQEALLRLEMLVQLGAPNWSLQSIRRLISLSLDLIVTVEKTPQGRRLKEIAQLHSAEEMGVTTEKVF